MTSLVNLLESFKDKFEYTGPYSPNSWCVNNLSGNPNITWDYISKNLDKNWNYYYLTENDIITLEIIESFPNLQWRFDILFGNPNITFDSILKNNMINYILNNNMYMYYLCQNVNITPEIVANNPHLNWDYKSLSRNHNMTSEFILQNLDKDWNFDSL
jgi:hypothetical protein